MAGKFGAKLHQWRHECARPCVDVRERETLRGVAVGMATPLVNVGERLALRCCATVDAVAATAMYTAVQESRRRLCW
jgi:hypothetical protein